jgi:hypothetical protein
VRKPAPPARRPFAVLDADGRLVVAEALAKGLRANGLLPAR